MADIVVGGFYGDEGKCKVVGYLAVKDEYDVVIRAGGGPQAGHTVTKDVKVTQAPSGLVNEAARLLIGRGTVLSPSKVLEEIKKYNLQERIGIDKGCTVIEPQHVEAEKELVARIGSVGTGVGPARVDRVLRKAKLAKDVPELKDYLVDVAREAGNAERSGKKVLIEGVQGFGLSLLDHEFYPYVTSQDTTASQFAADAGIGPKHVKDVVVVYKSYVSRVGQGEMKSQWTEAQQKELGIEERGTVSGRARRLGDFDKDLALESMARNTGTMAAITCVDRLFKGNDSITDRERLSPKAKAFIEDVNVFLQKSTSHYKGVKLVSTGPNLEDMVDLR